MGAIEPVGITKPSITNPRNKNASMNAMIRLVIVSLIPTAFCGPLLAVPDVPGLVACAADICSATSPHRAAYAGLTNSISPSINRIRRRNQIPTHLLSQNHQSQNPTQYRPRPQVVFGVAAASSLSAQMTPRLCPR